MLSDLEINDDHDEGTPHAYLLYGIWHRTPNTKHQAPSTEHQAPSTEHQAPPNIKNQPSRIAHLALYLYNTCPGSSSR
jgi:hypothetical protein